jgi:hypothetical protein
MEGDAEINANHEENRLSNDLERRGSMNQIPTKNKKALIIGSGIGGPAAAMALQRAGIEAVVYEAYDVPSDYAGLFLNTASDGLDVLRTLGIDVLARADGFPMPRMVMWSGTGKRLGEVANGIRLPDGTVSICVKRGLLQRCCARRPRAAVSRSNTVNDWLPTQSPGTAGWSPPSRTAPRQKVICSSVRRASTRVSAG